MVNSFNGYFFPQKSFYSVTENKTYETNKQWLKSFSPHTCTKIKQNENNIIVTLTHLYCPLFPSLLLYCGSSWSRIEKLNAWFRQH